MVPPGGGQATLAAVMTSASPPRPRFNFLPPGLSAAACVLGLMACSGPPTFSERDREAVQAVLHDQSDAWNRGDLDAFMAGYVRSSDLVFASRGDIRRGWKPARDAYEKRYGSGDQSDMGTLAFRLEELTPVAGNVAIVVGRYILTDTPQAGDGVFTLVFQRLDEGWRITHDHTSSAATSPEPSRARDSPQDPPAPAPTG